ncbi:HD domain-containing protein [Actinophytocola xanthii]|uniref:HD family phosphohydrolase n=1 Tax=Actinophytocola xanthii TaxID=1912961 RepID=UPI000B208331|nr:HD family phosphohydrolase [Actinophytocola xanthii]
MHTEDAAAVRAAVPAVPAAVLAIVDAQVRKLCARYAKRLPFHGWHHVSFVRSKAVQFAGANGAEVSVVETAALVHDVNYLVRRNSPAAAGGRLRQDMLARAGVAADTARWIEDVVVEAEMANRGPDISLEAQALSDADTLFKALPVTPVMLSHRYLAENGITLRELADKIVGEQQDKHDEGYYFYNTEAAATYSRWAATNLMLWQHIRESLDDDDVTDLLDAVNAHAAAS